MLASGAGLQKSGNQGEAPSLFPGEDAMLPVQGGEKEYESPKNVHCLHLALTLIFENGDSESEKCGQKEPEASRTGVEAGAGFGHRSSGAAPMTESQYRALSFKPLEVAFCHIQRYSLGTGW